MEIIVTGYPKSGNTWAARLIAECLDSPVVGFFNEPDNNEIAIEGLEREGTFKIYKSHSPPSEIFNINPTACVIHIHRDPRETLASALRFFAPRKYFSRFPFNQHFPFSFLYSLVDGIFPAEQYHRSRLIRAFASGDRRVHPALGISWLEFYSDCLLHSTSTHMLSYEELLKEPSQALKPVIAAISSSSIKNIPSAISNQSFSVAKKRFLKEGSLEKANFLKSGKTSTWETILTKNEIKKLKQATNYYLHYLLP